MKRILLPFIIGMTIIISGCTTTSSVIIPEYVSPNHYKTYDCNGLSKEYNRINTYLQKYKEESAKITPTGVNIGFYGNRHGVYPTINFGLGNSRDNKSNDKKRSRLYGERDAVIQAAKIQQCTFANELKLFGESS